MNTEYAIWTLINDGVCDDGITRYTQTAASVKDVVILLDLSGGAKDSSVEIAKETAKKIIDTFSDDDYMNVIKVR